VYLLARHQDVQARLRDEIRAHLPSGLETDTVSSLDIDRMPYLNAVCNEVLRYLPPVPLTLRQAARDTSIQGHFVPKGTRIMLASWAVNKSQELWGPDALEFNPDRWLRGSSGDDDETNNVKTSSNNGSGGTKSNYAMMSFLHGPRSCIGQQFAKAEFACLVAAFAGRFSFALHNEEERDERNIEIKGGITARPSKGMHVRMTVLEGW
jgi:cytochrome P450